MRVVRVPRPAKSGQRLNADASMILETMQRLGETGATIPPVYGVHIPLEQRATARCFFQHTLDDEGSPTPRSFKAAPIWRSDFAAAACLTSRRGPPASIVRIICWVIG
jgi:hypothetical protein